MIHCTFLMVFSLLFAEVIIGLAICGCLLFFLVLLLFVLLCRQKEPMASYSHVINESDSWQSYQLLRKEEFWDSEEDLWGHNPYITKKLKARLSPLPLAQTFIYIVEILAISLHSRNFKTEKGKQELCWLYWLRCLQKTKGGVKPLL